MAEELTNREYAALWFDDVADKTTRLTSGNVSHQGNTIKAMAKCSAHYLEQWGEKDDDLLVKSIGWFRDLAGDCDRLTAGNVSHMGATIRGKAIRCAEYVRKHINDK